MNTPDWIATLITLSIGYILGKGTITHDSIKEAEKLIEKQIKGVLHKDPVGPVNRPSATKVNMWADKGRTEEDEYMSSELEKVIGKPIG